MFHILFKNMKQEMKKLLNIIGLTSAAAFYQFATKLQFVLVMRASSYSNVLRDSNRLNIIVAQLICPHLNSTAV